jgi:hypothetical protein
MQHDDHLIHLRRYLPMTAHTFGSLFVKAWFDGPSLDPSSWQPSQGFVRFVERIFGASEFASLVLARGLTRRS